MSMFKQAHNVVLSTVSKLKEENYRSSSSSKPRDFSATIPAETVDKQKEAQNAAQQIINKSPRSAKGYLTSAQLYQENDDLSTAFNVYLQGLKFVAPDDPYYSTLIREKQRVATKIKQRSQGGFYNLLPYDILYLIFGNLQYKDLLNCVRVCRRWNDFMMEWPEFWNKMSSAMPNINQSTMISLLQGQTQELRLEGPIDAGLKHDILWFLSLWENNSFIQKIYLTKIDMIMSDISLLSEAIRCMSPSLKQIEWENCTVSQVDIIRNVIPACTPGLNYLSFSRNIHPTTQTHYTYYNRNRSNNQDYIIKLYRTPEKQTTLPSTINDYSTLTYLKIDTFFNSAPGYSNYHNSDIYVYTAALIKKCPNLVHLFLDSYGTDPRNLRNCLHQAVNFCPRLKTLVIFKNASMPQTVISNVDESDYAMTTINTSTLPNDKVPSFSTTLVPNKKNHKSIYQKITDTVSIGSPTIGLHRLVFSHHNFKVQERDVIQIFRSSHASFQLLYLGYDCVTVSAAALAKLASLGCPKLRELRIATGDSNSIGGGSSKPRMETVIVQLFSACPALEAIELDDSHWNYSYLKLNESVVEAIAQNCPHLRHLYFYTSDSEFGGNLCKSFLNFVNKGNNNSSRGHNNGNRMSKWTWKEKTTGTEQEPCRLECLKVTKMDPGTAYALVKNIESLKYLYIRLWWINIIQDDKSNNENLVQEIKNILKERGGALVVDYTNNK
ncbi:hypothetical protein BDA99DRAFT_576980 [Phascolomyces articulosus]|uniref:F-box domain-containing protein n=1 Tax=Phascolomyces articulosus TaxID=60185 RepID=A0AAD5P7U5_9FUNG|nr:hypothetical protein BDA99DRAFT_576980 [Phascolomyces articulosus]